MTKDRDLFDSDLVQQYLAQQIINKPTNIEDFIENIRNWSTATPSDFTERNLQQAFNTDIFTDILGYEQPRPGKQEFQLFPEELASTGDGFPDILLGHFKQSEYDEELEKDVRKVVGELKGPDTDLDKVDPSRLKSPVEQAFEYATSNGLSVRWIVVSNMKEIRLYHQSSIGFYYESWEISDFLNSEDELTDSFWEFYFIMHRDYLIGSEDGDSKITNLLKQNLSERQHLTEGFYQFYREAVEDIYATIAENYPELVETTEKQLQVVQSAQKFIHRGLVICFFSDHPSELLPKGLLKDIVETGENLPQIKQPKIYPLIKDLFRTIDVGSPEHYPHDIYDYDGGLFEEDEILTNIELPDDLFQKTYEIRADGEVEYTIEGVYGFYALNFHTELNEHVLGRIFEESVGDIEQVRANLAEDQNNPFSGTREEYGLYFTREGLTEFVAQNAIQDLLQEKRRQVRERLGLESEDNAMENPDREFLMEYIDEITDIKVGDIACGSGAFLVSCFEHLSREAKRVHEKIKSVGPTQTTLDLPPFQKTEVKILDNCLHGNDILQEAIEISKLSVWLRSARKEKSLAELTGNFASEDALAGEIQFEDAESVGFGNFDLIVGNPPWGGEISNAASTWVDERFGDEFDTENLDTYELFILTALEYLTDDGRLAFVLPQTLLNPNHSAVRQHLLKNHTFERYHILGADWFGPEIRMNTTAIQLQANRPNEGNTFKSITLVDDDRRQAIEGGLSLSQLESAYAFDIPQGRCIESGEIEPFRYVEDDEILGKMEGNSIPFGAFCESHRGVELNKAGHVIQCPACGIWMPPPRGRDPDTKKECPQCEAEFEYQERLGEEHIVSDDFSNSDVKWMDGDSFGQRYDQLDLKGLDLGYDGIAYKDEAIYKGEKIFIRQAGVGLSVAYEGDTVYCPQSVYIYKIRDDIGEMQNWYDDTDQWTDTDNIPAPDSIDRETYHKFLLGILNSRIFHYYVFKRFGEIDAAQAFAKLTQTKIRSLPIPVAKLTTDENSDKVAEIASCVEKLLNEDAELGDDTDWEIEQHLRDLYGLTGDDMIHISNQMGLVAYHQTMQELYPSGKPRTPERKAKISLDITAAEADD
jgi:type I restriction-modification system DNA methylase subunit